MKKKVCHVVLLKTEDIVCIEYFLLNKECGSVFAVVKLIERCGSPLDTFQSGKHLLAVKFLSSEPNVMRVNAIQEKWFFIDTASLGNSYVARIPNPHRYAIFK